MLVGVCSAGHAKAAKRWREAEARLHDAAAEARENSKYLATLGASLEPVLSGGCSIGYSARVTFECIRTCTSCKSLGIRGVALAFHFGHESSIQCLMFSITSQRCVMSDTSDHGFKACNEARAMA